MANVDQILSDPSCNLPEGAIPHHILVAIEYSVPGAENGNMRRLLTIADDENPPWLVQGMCCHIQDKVIEDMFANDEED